MLFMSDLHPYLFYLKQKQTEQKEFTGCLCQIENVWNPNYLNNEKHLLYLST